MQRSYLSYKMLFLIDLIMCLITVTVAGPLGNTATITPYNTNETINPTRRILKGRPVRDTRPYMVYLRAAPNADPKFTESDWTCGGVIIDERYILTSAACIEDAKQFFVVSGTSKWIPFSDKENECIKNGAKKAVWKCVPKSYVYDGDEFDNVRWMVGDIAVVKVEDEFNFEKRVRGCEFIPKPVAYNNRSVELEKARSTASIAGWGATEAFADVFEEKSARTSLNSPELLESEVKLVSAKNCKKRWEPRYHYVIDDNMVCTKDVTDDESMSSVCAEREINCKELQYSDSDEDYEDDDDKKDTPPKTRRMMAVPGELKVHTAGHFHDARRKNGGDSSGGFCENDHGGPLMVGQGKTSTVIGVMSACLTKDISRKCYGPFLFTSVYKYRNLISCAINKDIGSTCRNLLRSSKTPMVETHFDWPKNKDIARGGHAEEEAPEETTESGVSNTTTAFNKTTENHHVVIDKT